MKIRLILAIAIASLLNADQGAWQKIAYTSQTTTVQTVKNVPGVFGGYFISNAANAASSCVQVFDTIGTVTLGTTTPTMVFEIPASASANWELSQGISMTAGIKFAVATTCTGNTAPGSGLNITILYK